MYVRRSDSYLGVTEREFIKTISEVREGKISERIESIIEDINEHTIVERVDSDEVGGLKIFLSQGYLLEVSSNTSEDDEYSEFWRLFKPEGRQPLTLLSQEMVLKTSNRIIKETKKAQTR